jgi:hypothetical protein
MWIEGSSCTSLGCTDERTLLVGGGGGGLAPSILGTSKTSITSSLGASCTLLIGLTLNGNEVLALTPSTGQQHETGLVHREPR